MLDWILRFLYFQRLLAGSHSPQLTLRLSSGQKPWLVNKISHPVVIRGEEGGLAC